MATAIDNLGRQIETTNMTLGEIKALVGTMMKSKVGAARPVGGGGVEDGKPNESLLKVRELLEQYTKDFAKDVTEQKGFLSDIVDALKDLTQKRVEKKEADKGKPKTAKEKNVASKEEKTMAQAMNGLYQAGVVKRHSLAAADAITHAKLDAVIAAINGLAGAMTGAMGGGGGSGGKGGGGAGGGAGGAGGGPKPPKQPKQKKLFGTTVLIEDEQEQKDMFYMSYMEKMLHRVRDLADKVQTAFLGWNAWTVLTKGLIEEERKFTQEIRAVAYETAGVTKETRSLQHAFEAIGKSSAITGMDRTAFQQSYNKALKGGVKDLRAAVAMTQAQLNVENQLGLKAGDLQDTFQSWHQSGRMTVTQMADMGRGMRDVAKFTGMTGEALKGAIESSKEFITTLRNAAQLTAMAAKNVIEIGANAKKLGIESEMQPLMKAMASSSHLLLEASGQTQAMLFRAAASVGRMDDLMNGTILRSKAGIKDMAKGLENILKDFGVESLEAIDQLSDVAKRDLNIRLKASLGIELGQLRSQIETLQEAGKGYADRIADINKKLQQNITIEERAALMEQARALKVSKSLDVLTALDEAAKGAKDMNQALATFGKRKSEFEADMNAMGQQWTSEADVAKGAITNALSSVNEGLKKAGKQELKIDSTEIEKALQDPTAMRELTAKISKGQQELSTAQKAQLDPMTEMAQSLREINDSMRNFTQSLFSKMFDSGFGKLLAITGVVAGIIAGLAIAIGQAVSLWRGIKDLGRSTLEFLAKKFGVELEVEDKKSEKALEGVAKALEAETKKETDSFAEIIKLLAAIKDCVCKPQDKATAAAAATAPATAEATAPAIEKKPAAAAFGASKKVEGLEDPAVVKAKLQAIQKDDKLSAVEKKMMTKDIVYQRKEIVMQKKDIKSQKTGDKVQKAQQNLVADQAKTPGVGAPPSPEGMGFDIKSMLASAGDMKKVGAVLAVVLAGALVLGAAIILGAKLIKGLNLDMGSIMMAAALMAGVGVAAAAMVAGVIAIVDSMKSEDIDEFSKKAETLIKFATKNKTTLLKVAAAMIIIGPILVLTGIAIIKAIDLILKAFGMNLASIAETAITAGAAIAAIVGAIALIMCHLPEAVEKLEEIKKNPIFQNPQQFVKDLWKPALALALIVPAVVFLASAILTAARLILKIFGLDAKTAWEVGYTVAAVLAAAGIIALAAIGAAVGLKLLGAFVVKTAKFLPLMLLGAKYLAIFVPAVIFLGSAILFASRLIMGIFGLTPKVAMETGLAVAAVLISAGIIAMACLGASLGLAQLGIWLPTLPFTYKLMWAGTLALLIMTPLVLALGGVILTMARVVLGLFQLTPKVAMDTGKAVAAVLIAAGLIALACLGASLGLSWLGGWLPTLPFTYKLMKAGAIALIIMTGLIVTLAAIILRLASVILGLFKLDAAKAMEIGKAVAAVMITAGLIAAACLGASWALSQLGLWLPTMPITIPLMKAGAIALLLMTGAIVGLAAAILTLANWILGVFELDAKKAKAIGEAVYEILWAAGKIALMVLAVAGIMAGIGALIAFVPTFVPMMFAGAAAFWLMSKPVMLLVAGILAFAKAIDASVGMDNAVKYVSALESILWGAGKIALLVIGMGAVLAALGTFAIFSFFAAAAMWAGAFALLKMAAPVMLLTYGILAMGKALMKQISPEEGTKIAEAVKVLFEAAGKVSDIITSQMQNLLLLGAISIIGWIIIPILNRGAKFFMSLAQPVAAFTIGLIMLGRMMVAAAGGIKGLKKTIEGIELISKAIVAIGDVMNTLYKVILPLVKKPWFGLWGSSKLDELAEAMPLFQNSFISITQFIRDGIIQPIRQNMKNAKQMMKVIDTAKAMAELIKAIDPIMTGLLKVILPLTDRGWFGWFSSPLDKLTAAIPLFQASFQTIITFVKEGIIKPIQRGFKDISKVKKVSEAAKAIGDAMSAIAPMLDKIQKVVLDMTARPGFLFFSWGSSKLDKLKEAMPKFQETFQIIVDFVKNGVIKPITRAFPNLKKVQSVVQIAAAIGSAVGEIANVVDVLANKITPMTERGGFWSRWFGDARSKVEKIEAMMPDFARIFSIIVNFLKNSLIGIVVAAFPNLQSVQATLPIIKAVGEAIKAIADAVDVVANKLAPMTERAGFWASLFGDARSPLEKMEAALPDIKASFLSITWFVKGLLQSVEAAFPDLKKAETSIAVVKKIGEAIEAVADILEKFQEIQQMVAPFSFFAALFPDMAKATSPLEAAIPPIKQTFNAITKFVQEGIIAPVAGLNLKGLDSSVKKLRLMAKAIEVMQEMIEAFEGMVGMTQGKPSVTTGMWWWKKTTAAVAPMTDQLNAAIPQIKTVFTNIMDFVKEGIVKPVEKLNGIDLKKVVKTLMWAALALEKVPDMMENLGDVLKLLSPDGRNMQSRLASDMINEMQGRWKGWYAWVFTGMAKFIADGIIAPISTHLNDVKKIKNVVKIVVAAAVMLEKIPDMMENLGDALKLLSPDGNVLQSHLATQIINEMQGKWKGWYAWVFTGMAKFISEGIVEPIFKNLKDVKKIQAVAKILVAAATMMSKLPIVMEKLGDALRLLSPDGNVMQSALVTQIQGEQAGRWKGWYARQFTDIAKFVNEGIVNPIYTHLKDVKKIQAVAKILVAAACMMSKLPIVMEKLGIALRLLSPDGDVMQSALVTQMQNELAGKWKGWYARTFTSIAVFLKEGIIDPIYSQLSDVGKIQTVAKILVAAAIVLTKLPIVLEKLGEALQLLSPDGNVLQSTLTTQMQNEMSGRWKGWYERTFTSIAIFMREGIVNPILRELPEPRTIMMAAKILTAMAKVITLIPRVINGIANGLIPLIDSGMNIQREAPAEVILEHKDQFKDWFTKIAIFMREGIVKPILEQLPEPRTIMMAAKILQAMSRIIRLIPVVIRGISNGLLPLMESKDIMKDAPMEAIIDNKALFKEWFTQIAAFMRDGIVWPILNELPEPRTIMLAAKILQAMGRILTILPVVIRKLSALFIPLDPNKCMQDSPVGALATNAPMFAEWFWTIAAFIRVGILYPIMNFFPDEKEIEEVAKRLQTTNQVIDMLPPFLYGLAAKMGALTQSVWGLSPMARIGQQVATFADYFYNIARAIILGIIYPIKYGFPSSDDIEDIEDRLDSTIKALDSLTPWLDKAGVSLDNLYKARWRNYFAAYDAESFAPYFWRITSAIGNGILRPMQTLPTSDEIFEINRQMEEMAKAIDSAGTVLTVAGVKMDKFAKGWFWRLIDGWRADMFGATFMNMAQAINRGILWPVKNLLPKSSEIEEVVTQLDQMVKVLNMVGEVLDAMSQAMADIANADIDFTALDTIPIDKMAMFAGALKDMSIATSSGIDLSGGGAGGGGADPSAKAIETQIAAQQADAQTSMATNMAQLLAEAMSGDGLVVRDILGLKMQRRMAQMQQEESHSATMPTAAQASAQRQVMTQALGGPDALRPAIQAVNPAPAAGTADMRRASQSMRDTPEQRATADERAERRQRNRFTDRRAQREEARRLRREGAGFGADGEVAPRNPQGQGVVTDQAITNGVENQGGQQMDYRLASASGAEQIAQQGMMPQVAPPQMGASERDVLAALVRLVNSPTAVSGIAPSATMSVETASAATGTENANMQPVVQPSLALPDMNQIVSGDRASTQPATTEVVSPELGDIATETCQQTTLQEKLVGLFEQVRDLLQPKTPPNSGTSTEAASTAANVVDHPPPNYHRPTTGLVGQSAAKAVLNLGPPKA